MSITAAPPTPAQALGLLDCELDLKLIRWKLADRDEGPGYSAEHLDLLEGEYRKFLALRLAHQDIDVVPCKIVDEMWHRHILDTAAYRQDCDRLFGHFVDHFPYFGMRSDRDAEDLLDAYAETLNRYRVAFGDPPLNTWTTEGADVSRCRTACKPQRCR